MRSVCDDEGQEISAEISWLTEGAIASRGVEDAGADGRVQGLLRGCSRLWKRRKLKKVAR